MKTSENSPQIDWCEMESDASTSSQAAGLARTFPQPGKGPDYRAPAADCGTNILDSFARLDPDTQSWKTCQRCLVEGWETYSEGWPRSGLVVAGTVSLPLPSGHRIVEIESGS